MIVSASRRTDIPNYYSDWFYKRMEEGFLYIRNPMNTRQISKIALSLELVDCIVFWTKNPEAMLERMDELDKYKYYFQFTLTGYGKDIEPGLPDKPHKLIPVFHRLSKRVGRERVIWRYDSILLNHTYTIEYHLKAFGEIAEKLKDYTDKVKENGNYYDVDSPLLCGVVNENDILTERKVKSLKIEQLSLFDFYPV